MLGTQNLPLFVASGLLLNLMPGPDTLYIVGRSVSQGRTAGLASVLGIPRKGGDKEALLLFTSGSAGEPKGVPLTHRNMMANVCQFGSRLKLTLGTGDSLLGCLPLFHSFGCTVTLWYPIIEGIGVVTYPTPIETKALADLIGGRRPEIDLAGFSLGRF